MQLHQNMQLQTFSQNCSSIEGNGLTKIFSQRNNWIYTIKRSKL
jgi:hypothetical protein